MRILVFALLLGLLLLAHGCQQCGQRSPQRSRIEPSIPAMAPSAQRTKQTSDSLFAQTIMTRDRQDQERSAGEEPPSIRDYPQAERTSLPPPRPKANVTLGQAMQPAATSVPNLELLSDLLHYSYGETGGKGGLRAAASAGALYPADVFVSVRRANAIDRGVYYYDPHRHSLARVAAPELATSGEPPISIIFAASYARTAFKYGARAPRYVGLDVGHVAANSLLVAAALGLGCHVNTSFVEQTHKAMLGLTSNTEGVLLVLDCGMLQASSPKAAALPARDLFETIRARRSHRHFGARKVKHQALVELLAAVTLPLGFSPEANLVQPWVFLHAVSDLAAGLYRYDRTRAELVLVTSGDHASGLARAGLGQPQLAEAAYVIAWTIVEERMAAFDGAPGFRDACLQAGVMGELGYLVATAQNLGSCGVGAFYDEELGKLFGEAPRQVLYLLAVGEK